MGVLGIEGQPAIGGLECRRPAPAAQFDTRQQAEIVGIVGVEPDRFLGGGLGLLKSVLIAENTATYVVAKGHARVEPDRLVGLVQRFVLAFLLAPGRATRKACAIALSGDSASSWRNSRSARS